MRTATLLLAAALLAPGCAAPPTDDGPKDASATNSVILTTQNGESFQHWVWVAALNKWVPNPFAPLVYRGRRAGEHNRPNRDLSKPVCWKTDLYKDKSACAKTTPDAIKVIEGHPDHPGGEGAWLEVALDWVPTDGPCAGCDTMYRLYVEGAGSPPADFPKDQEYPGPYGAFYFWAPRRTPFPVMTAR